MAVERANAQQGQTVTLRMRFELGGTLFDPSSVNQVQIINPAGVVEETIPAASIVHDGVGLYHVDWAIPAAATIDVWHDRWFANSTVGAVEKQFTLSFYVLPFTATGGTSPYLTSAEALAYLPSDTTITATEAAEMAALAQEIVEAVTGDFFLPVEMARIFDGNGEAYLPLDLELQSVTGWDVRCCLSSGATTDWEAQDATTLRIAGSRMGLTIGNLASFSRQVSRRYQIERFTACGSGSVVSFCGVFSAGTQNHRITGTWGRWTTVPLQIKAAIGLMVRYAGMCDDPKGVPSNPYVSESIPGGRSYTLRQIRAGATKDTGTGYPDVDAILARVPQPMIAATVV
jgi:hypothetical protein